MQALERHLTSLQSVLTGDDNVSSVLNPITILSDINDFCARIREEEIGLCSSLLFDEDKGLFRFVDQSLKVHESNKQMTLARKAVFDFLHNYVKQVERRIADYALEIKRWCLNTFRRDQSNLVKQATFPPIIKLIEMDLPVLDEQSLEVKQLYDIYLREFLKGKSSAMGLKASILHMLGVLSEHFPGEVSSKSKQLFQIYMDTLKTQSNKAEPDTQLIAASFKGLSSFLNNFGGDGSSHMKELYGYMSKCLEHTNATRHDVPKAALLLLDSHAFQFKEYLTVDAEKMFERMKVLCCHRNDKVRKQAFPALDSFLSHVAFELVKGPRSIEQNQRTFGLLLEQFSKMLDAKTGNKYQLSIAIRSYGCFAAPMRKFLGQTDTKFILMKLLKFSDQLLTRSQEELEESVVHLPSFLISFANIILELEVVDGWIIDHLERIIGVLFLVFPKHIQFPKYKYAIYIALVRLFVSLYLKQNSLDQLLSRIVFQGLALTISNSVALGADIEETNQEQPLALYEQYMDLWYNLLNPKNIQLSKWNYPWSELDLTSDLQDHMFSIIYDKIFQSMIDLLNKLDLRCKVVEQNEHQAPSSVKKEMETTDDEDAEVPIDILSNIKPVNQKDFELYLNLVEFCKKFMRKCQAKHFVRWVYIYCRLLIDKANKYQYVSGFYKILTVGMKICDEYDYFEGITESSQVYDLVATSDEQSNIRKLFVADSKTKITCFHMLSKFCKETISRLFEFKGDLLAACIRFILSMPKQFIEPDLFVTPLNISFEMGLSYLPLASVGISALENYLKVLSRDALLGLLSQVLPALSEYLIVKSSSDEEDDKKMNSVNNSLSKNRIRSTDVEQERRKQIEAARMFKDVNKIPLRGIQLRIIRLLGKLGGQNSLILKDSSSENKDVIAWDTKERIQFSIPFRDVKPEIFYDSILPRVVELAEKSGDRQTKIAACEFLHSLVLYMVGRNAYSPQARQRAQQRLQEQQEAEKKRAEQTDAPTQENKTEPSSDPTPFYNIYERIFPSLLRLAVDTEVVTKQLFEPLMYQVTHWLTQNMQYENKETMVLLDTMIEGLSNPKDGALRDLCANLLNEFLKWSVKHERDSKYHNIKSLFRRLYSYSHHPNVHKRLGAILGFNRMYRSFREVDDLVDRHVLDWLHNVMTSLRVSNGDETASGVVDRTKELLSHIEKIIVFKSKVLQQKKSDRGMHTNLEETVEWIFGQCCSSHILCRKQAMRLFPALCVALDGFNSDDGPKRWLHKMMKQKGISFIIGALERDLLEAEEHLEKEERRQVKDISSFPSKLSFWWSTLEAYLDYVLWLFENSLVYPHQLFSVPKEQDPNDERAKRRKLSESEEATSGVPQTESNALFKHIFKFIKEYSLKKIGQIIPITGAEEEKLRTKKCVTVIKVMDFMVLMTEKFSDTLLKQDQKLLMTNFYGLLFACVLNPERLGFITTDEKVQTHLPKQIKRIVYAVLHDKKIKEEGHHMNMINTLKKLLNSDGRMNLSRFTISDVSMNMDDATFLFRGYRLLHMLNILDGNMTISSPQLSLKLGTMIFEYESLLSPVQVHIANELWKLCFEFGFPPKVLVQFLMDTTVWGKDDLLSQRLSQIEKGNDMVDEAEQNQSLVALATKGEVFYKNFKNEINEYLILRIETMAKELLAHVTTNSLVFDIFFNISEVFLRNRKLDSKKFVLHLLQNISMLVHHAITDQKRENIDFRINTLKLLEKVLLLDSQSLSDKDTSHTIMTLVLFALKSKRDSSNPSIDLKLQGIRAIPLIINHLSVQDKQQVLQQIKSIIINEFPLSFTELQPNTAAYEDHISMLEEILSTLEKSGSIEIMEQVIPIFRWSTHPLKSKMSRLLNNFFSKLSSEDILSCSTYILKTFFNESLPIDIRQNVVQWVLMICLQAMHEKILTQFFELNIKRFVDSITKNINYDATVMNADDLKGAYLTKTCCMNIVEAMYRLLPAAAVKDSINKVYCNNKDGLNGKELTEKVMRATYAARSYTPPEDELTLVGNNLILEYHMAAYNALAGAVKCTQTQEKFYTGFLFKEKNNDLWDNIVDLQQSYEFQIETNFRYYKKAVEELRIDTNKSTSSTKGNRMKYLSSQYLADSSLSSEIPYIGSFFVPGSRYAIAGTTAQEKDEKESIESEKTAEVEETVEESTLELDDINSNPCMTTVLRMIEYLTKTFKPDKGTMPSWMQEMHKKFDDDISHPNVKIFLAKIIINRPSVFEPYATEFFGPLVKLCVSKQSGGSGIHYFLRDILILLLKWKDMMPPDTLEGRQLASTLIAHLMKNCAHQKHSILRSNLEMIKLLVEKWKSRITIQKNIILGWICFDTKSNQAKLARTTGLQLLGILIANDIPAYDPEFDATIVAESKFYERILENMVFHYKEVYEASAEVAGMLLNQLSTTNTGGSRIEESLATFQQLLLANLNSFLANKQYDRFLNCLNKIGIHSTPFLDNFLPKKLLEIMPHLFGVYKKIALQIISWRGEHIPDLYQSMRPYITQFVQQQEEATQLLTLQIVLKLLRGMTREEVLHFVQLVKDELHTNEVVFHSTFSETCRSMYYDILIWVFDNKEGFKTEDCIRTELVKGLCDKSEAVRKKVLDFWDQESRLSVESLKRLEQVFTTLYSHNLGESWLSNASYLLLQLVHRSPDFEDSKAIFSESLSNCDFKEYQIDVSWQSRSLPMTPLFSSSLTNQSSLAQSYSSSLQSFTGTYNPEANASFADEKSATDQKKGAGFVKATQTAQFSMTQYGHSVRDVLSDPSLSQTSLLFTPFKRINSTQGTASNTPSSTQQTSELPVPFRRRFLALKATQETNIFAKRQMRLKKEKEAWEARHKIQRKNKVTMYRKYRTGELPDIQIAIKELILPLQALCLSDLTIAKNVFVSLFSALYPAIGEKLPEKDANTVSSKIHKQFKRIMTQSKDCSLLISSLLSLCLKHTDLIGTTTESLTPGIIKDVSLQSHNVELGCLVLEHYISKKFLDSNNMEEEEEETEDKKLSELRKERIESWIEMSKLYKSLKDDDIVRSIFENNVSEQEVTQKGLEFELNGEFNDASKLYNEALKEFATGWKRSSIPPYSQEIELWKERQLECLKKLNMWDKLSEYINKEARNDITKIWTLNNSDLLIPAYIESQLKIDKSTEAFQHFLEDANTIVARRSLLESKYSSELAAYSIIRNQNEKAKSHVIDAYGYFIVDWSTLSPLARTGRQSYLQKLQRIVEIEEYVNFLNLPTSQKQSGFLRLMNSWRSRTPSVAVDDIQVWDDIVTNREKIFDNMLKHMDTLLAAKDANQMHIELGDLISSTPAPTISSSFDTVESLSIISATDKKKNDLDKETVAQMICDERSRTFLLAAKAARKQLYTTAAQKYLKASKASNSEKPEFGYMFFSSLVKLMRMKGNKHKDFKNKYDTTLNFFKTHESKYDADETDPSIRIKFISLLADTYKDYAQILSDHGQASVFGTHSQIQEKALTLLSRATEIAVHQESIGEQKIAKTFLKLGEYSDTLLSSDTKMESKSKADLAELSLSNLLQAMKHNSDSAKNRFARLLEIIELYPETRRTFSSFINERSMSIPNWMFIPWISQILAHMNGEEAPYLIPILDSIAEAYPQALFYPMNISRSDIKNNDRLVQSRLTQVEQKLKHPMLRQFVISLRDLDHPELRWKAWTDDIKACYKNNANNKTKLQQELKELWAQTFDDLFDVNKPYLGVYNKRFAKNWSPYMKQDFGGRDASKLLQMDAKTFDKKATKKMMDMRKTKGALLPGKSKLNYFSAWLADFYASAESTLSYIEAPGQYGSSSSPDPEKHVKIVNFDPSILVMGSMRKPKRIKIHGNDEKDYMFLVKGGEDLRQDQRIEQLFEVMNKIMQQDAACCKRNLFLKLYKVIPMAKDVGIIEWVENTKPLKAIIEEELAKYMNSPQAEVLRHPTTMMHMKMLASCQPKDTQLAQHQQYLCMFQKVKRDVLEKLIYQQYQQIPPDLLKNGISTISSSPEAFFTLRNRYAKSLAVFNTCSYILGIGDRHLENFLLDCSDGQIVGIDFGHAFGSATEILPVPELMPFRLTRQLLHVMHPLSASTALSIDSQENMIIGGGLYKESMIHTMTALHNNQDILLNTMDVFIKEPLVDWLKFANKNKKQQEKGDNEDQSSLESENSQSWYPQRKIKLAKQKLNMMNPVSIFLDDVDANASLKPVLKYIKQAVIGDEEHNIRARIGPNEQCSSIKTQVECLIDMATDPNILGRTYIGWCSHF